MSDTCHLLWQYASNLGLEAPLPVSIKQGDTPYLQVSKLFAHFKLRSCCFTFVRLSASGAVAASQTLLEAFV